MTSVLLLSGGVSHDFAASSAALAGVLTEAGAVVTVEEDPNAFARQIPDHDILAINALRWRMTNAERFAPLRPRWGYETTDGLRDGIAGHLAQGRGIYALHAASICFDDWPEWRDILGAAWQWDVSRHDPVGPAHVEFKSDQPIVADLPDFDVIDEIYTQLSLAPDAVPLAWALQGAAPDRHPVLFAREVMGGRVVYDALGHDPRSIDHPVHKRLIRRALNWVQGRDPQEEA